MAVIVMVVTYSQLYFHENGLQFYFHFLPAFNPQTIVYETLIPNIPHILQGEYSALVSVAELGQNPFNLNFTRIFVVLVAEQRHAYFHRVVVKTINYILRGKKIHIGKL